MFFQRIGAKKCEREPYPVKALLSTGKVNKPERKGLHIADKTNECDYWPTIFSLSPFTATYQRVLKEEDKPMVNSTLLDSETFDLGDIDLQPIRAALPALKIYRSTDADAVAERLKGAEVVIANKTHLDSSLLEAVADHLRLIVVAATGTNNIDLESAHRLGIQVCNVRNYATPAVVQHTLSLMLALTTHLVDYHHAILDGKWSESRHFCLLDHPIRELAGRKLGVVGFGVLGQAVARVAEVFGMTTLIANRPGGVPQVGRLSLDELLPQIDVLTLHCPLTAATEGLIDSRALAMMRSDAIIINTARGGIIDELALADALRRGVIGGAGIDVLTQEPPPSNHPLLSPDIPNLLLSPHSAWGSRETRQRLVHEVALNIDGWKAGTPRNLVN